MPIDRPAVDYYHELGSRDGTSFRDSFGPDETTSTARFRVPWEQRYDAVIALLGYSQLAGTTAVPTALERLTPSRHPDIASAVNGAGHLYATKVPSLTGFSFTTFREDVNYPGAYLNQFDKADLEVQYEQVPYGVLEDGEVTAEYERYTSIESLSPSADYLMLPGGTMVYLRDSGTGAPHNRAIPFNTGTILPVVELKVKWWSLPFGLYSPLELGPWATRVFGDGTDLPYLGSVNQTELFGYHPGTLLFSAVELIPRRFPLIGLGWDVVFTLAVDVNRWNFKLFVSTDPADAAATGFYYVARRGASYAAPGTVGDFESIYKERELADLWDVT